MNSKPKRMRGRNSRCGATRKVCFKSHAAAMARACEILGGDDPRAMQFRAYRCEYCGLFHITSK